MRHELSTPYTWVYRWLIPALLTVIAIAALWQFLPGEYLPEASGAGVSLKLAGAMLIAAAALLLSRIFDRAKRVWLSGQHLIFAAYGKEYTTPLSNITAIRETPFFRPHRIEVQFAEVTSFGKKIIFFPPLSLRNLTGQHPCTEELRNKITR